MCDQKNKSENTVKEKNEQILKFSHTPQESHSLSEFWNPLDLVGFIEFLYVEKLQTKYLRRIYKSIR